MKKKKIIIISAVALILFPIVAYLIAWVIWLIFYTSGISSTEEYLLEYQSEFEEVAKLCYDDYVENDRGKRNDINTGVYLVDDEAVCVLTDDESIDIYDNEEVLNIIGDARLCKKRITCIYVYDTFVSFSTDNGVGSFVYSVNDEKPKYINRPDEDKHIIRKRKPTEHWYYMKIWGA